MRTIFCLSIYLLLPAISQAHDPRPVGDGRVSSSPQIGHVYACQQRFNPNAPGAHTGGDWIQNGMFYPAEKVTVGGSVTWPNSQVSIRRNGAMREIIANNLPKHPTGVFPVRRNDPAYSYDRNPNPIRTQDIHLRLPAEPSPATRPSCVPMGLIGFTVTGGALYNALDARGDDAAAHEILDACGGHPQEQGQYHYHANSDCYPQTADVKGHGHLIGYALDGFGLFGPIEDGQKITTADLDSCHGHTGSVNWDGLEQQIYHYHVTDDYPYSVGCFTGSPVAAASSGSASGSTPMNGGDPIANVARELGIDADQLRRAVGPAPPNIERAARQLGVDARRLHEAFERHRQRR